MDTATQPVTAVVRRRIKPGSEDVFEVLMRDSMGCVVGQSGHVGIHAVRTVGSLDYTDFDRFATIEDGRRFTDSAEYAHWMARLDEVSVEWPKIDEIVGLAFWFPLPDEPGHQAPPKMKLFLLMVLGGYPLRSVFPRMLSPLALRRPPLLRELFLAITTVAVLTWVAMSNLIHLFQTWLPPSNQRDSLCTSTPRL